MPTIEELLRKTLSGPSPEFKAADRDLHKEVREASVAVESITGGTASLRLAHSPKHDSFRSWPGYQGAVYQLLIVLGDEEREINAFVIPPNGYPILQFESVQAITEPPRPDELRTPEELHQAFERMATDRNSRLVAYLAFAVRNREVLSAQAGENSDGE